MGIEDAVDNRREVDTTKSKKERLWKEGLCPACGMEGRDTDRWYFKCINGSCDVVTFISVEEREKVNELVSS